MNENYNTNRNDALDWDSVIEAENEFVLLPEGEYEFTVKNFERGYFNGSEKMSACPKAELTLQIDAPQGTAIVKHNLFLSRKTEGLVCAFFYQYRSEETRRTSENELGAGCRFKRPLQDRAEALQR